MGLMTRIGCCVRDVGALCCCCRQHLPLFPLDLQYHDLGSEECPASCLFAQAAGEWVKHSSICTICGSSLSLCFPPRGKWQAIWGSLSCSGGGELAENSFHVLASHYVATWFVSCSIKSSFSLLQRQSLSQKCALLCAGWHFEEVFGKVSCKGRSQLPLLIPTSGVLSVQISSLALHIRVREPHSLPSLNRAFCG